MLAVGSKYGGIYAGAENGLRGYQLTFMIAYIRDCFMYCNMVAESFETSCPWDKVEALCTNVEKEIYAAGALYGQKRE